MKDVLCQLGWASVAIRRARRAARSGDVGKTSDAVYAAAMRLMAMARKLRLAKEKA